MFRMKNNDFPTSDTRIGFFLRGFGIAPTSPRRQIAATLLAKHQHITAEQLHTQLCQNGRDISKATVYNTLGLFVQKGLLREIIVDSSHSYFDSNISAHHHFYNLDTGELSDIPCTHEHEQLSCLNPADIQLPKGTTLDQVEVVVKVRNNRA